jgi:ribosome-binding protein aMBF1 (putative translation factor)
MPQVPLLTADGPEIRARRLRAGLTATELAGKIRRHPQTVRRLEAGRLTAVSETLIHQLAWALEVSADEITKSSEDETAA